ncbi:MULTISPECIES: ATP-dependent zinc metalloprotease FtsH [unclassified Mesotoga]|uniref:ATP-dependent zinc metalloprotease FtsH n=1 Tax=unclassified Mesotoga TaxID=1184398 RepID=UPI000EF1C79D|nr:MULTISPECIES: ATP-dependent zinc metalloprotease FtsH [unclassified Mesotoga]MDD3680325.1 ATP-dependent zinc metalloprotease FtsH [Mesotoga sp.]MDD4206900.1 ATP-dependent zinc metalloprotease FtsH [Mesotoga sp.]MDD5682688.1 ATP-dependent zinc metalloprotease FtsH [Mesotoga sp.]RLL87228.1 cell division protein FtsH [Mesotoga sp. BH458_6_3_2_1]
MDQKPRIGMILFYVVLGIFLLIALRGLYPSETSVVVPYTKFLDDFNNIIDIVIYDNGKVMYITGDNPRRSLETYVPSQTLVTQTFQNHIDRLAERGVNITFERGSDSLFWVNLLGTIIPLAIIIFIWFFLMRSMSGRNSQAFTFTKSPAKKYVSTDKKVTFKDVAGVEEAQQELADIVSYLKDPTVFADTGARMPKGLLLVGPPGTGKTLLARAVAGEAGVPFFFISGSDFVELFVGVGAARVRDLFTQAKSSAPAILFIDEIDAVGRHRGAGLGGGHDEREQTLNQILVEMDGFDAKTDVIVIAATNRPDILDKALLRPGRFDKKISVDPPDLKGRSEILKIHMRGKPIDPEVDVQLLGRRTPGFVGADLENLINEAAILSARKKKKMIGMTELEEAIDRVLAGPAKRSRIISEREKKILAYHELGHAVVGLILPKAFPVHKVTIIPRGTSTLGFTESLPLEDRYLITKSELLDNMSQALGGRAAEDLVFGEITTGAASDLERASAMARSMVTQFGMSERLGPIAWGKEEDEVFLGRELTRMKNYSEEIASEIDSEVKTIVLTCYEKAKRVLSDHRKKLDEAADYLLQKETISGRELAEILELKAGNYYKDDLEAVDIAPGANASDPEITKKLE